MLKSAILYADEVEVCSYSNYYATERWARGKNISQLSTENKFDFIADVFGDFLRTRGFDLDQLLEAKKQYIKLKLASSLTDKEKIRKSELEKLVNNLVNDYDQEADSIFKKEGFLDIFELAKLKQVDFVNLGQRSDSVLQILNRFVSVLKKSINDSQCLPLIDSSTKNLVSNMVASGDFVPSTYGVSRANQAGMFTNLLNRLPEFEKASIDEVLDIRRELERPLKRFRGKLSKLSADFTNASWDEDFVHDVERCVREDIKPEIEEIRDAVESNSYMAQLNSRLTDSVTKVGMQTLSLSLLSQSASALLLGGVIAAGSAAYKASRDFEEAQAEVESNSLYFYYRLDEEFGE